MVEFFQRRKCLSVGVEAFDAFDAPQRVVRCNPGDLLGLVLFDFLLLVGLVGCNLVLVAKDLSLEPGSPTDHACSNQHQHGVDDWSPVDGLAVLGSGGEVDAEGAFASGAESDGRELLRPAMGGEFGVLGVALLPGLGGGRGVKPLAVLELAVFPELHLAAV